MSKYTTQVRFICERAAGFSESADFAKVDDIITAAIPKIFSFDFPIFDEDYRNVLCKKILKHYYTREIGLETVGLWKLKLDTKMNEIMPYYNKLYESANEDFNPLYDADYTRTTTGGEDGSNSKSVNGTDTNTSTGTVTDAETNSGTNSRTGTVEKEGATSDNNSRWDLYSDTPQGSIAGVETGNYLTNARKITDDGDGTSDETTTYDVTDTYSSGKNNTRTNNLTDRLVKQESESGSFETTKEYVERIVGKFPGKSYAKMIMEYRETLLNIDMQIIDDLSELFMKVW